MNALKFLLHFVLIFFSLEIRTKCEQTENQSNRIIGGKDTEVQYEWFSAIVAIPLRRVDRHIKVLCGGSLITIRDVLTAAHCFNKSPPPEKNYIVVMGLQNICRPSSSATQHKIHRVVIHEEYDSGRYDIAIVTTVTEIDSTPICLPLRIEHQPMKGEVIGFGYKNDYVQPCNLQVVTVETYAEDVCQKILGDHFSENRPETFCAGELAGGLDACYGDSGGPFQLRDGDLYTLLGIVSFGYGCAQRGQLGFYTNVTYFVDWIEKRSYGTICFR